MKRCMAVTEDYLYIPVNIKGEEKEVCFYCGEQKILEFKIPIMKGTEKIYEYDYLAPLPIANYRNQTLTIEIEEGTETNTKEDSGSELFLRAIKEASQEEVQEKIQKDIQDTDRPRIHFTAYTGWINDPNGLVYQNGCYHMYFQYNPFHVKWNNMSWGHAVSKDLLHWEQKDTVLFPDKEGMMFSGSAICNEQGLLGLPKDALLFFYSVAGGSTTWSREKEFTQKVAYSLDQGAVLIKTERGKLDTICKENRDPKVFWHAESQAYIMTLWLEENDFAILRSVNLENWTLSHRFTLEKAWECPDLLQVYAEDGSSRWLFWSADGFYFLGDFDGYQFQTDGIRHEAYFTKVPYAAQTYAGIKDRIISVPWLRTENAEKMYTGTMGIPRELSLYKEKGQYRLAQNPIRELEYKKRKVFDRNPQGEAVRLQKEKIPLLLQTQTEKAADIEWNIYGNTICYHPQEGTFTVEKEVYEIGKDLKEFSFLIDDDVFEVTANHGIIVGVMELKNRSSVLEVHSSNLSLFDIYEID